MKQSIASIFIALFLFITLMFFGSCKSPVEPKKETGSDTTSHNFSWQMWEFGDLYGTGYTSMFFDVAIVTENDIWAVGDIKLKDSTGKTDAHWINAMHWNGIEWKPFKLQFYDYPGLPSTFSYPANSVCVLDSGKIIVSHANQVTFIKDEKQLKTEYIPIVIGKIWAKNSNDIYAVGAQGGIVHYDGKAWKKIESGTTMHLVDIFSKDGKDFYASGGDMLGYKGVVLKGDATGFNVIAEGKPSVSTEELFNPYFVGVGSMLWVSPSDTVYFGGSLLFAYKDGKMDYVKTLAGNKTWMNVNGDYWGYLSGIRGNSDNDIALVGEGNTIRHFNGKNWKQLGMPYNYTSEYFWGSVDMKKNTIAAVGRSNTNGIIMILKRGN
ncbi:MAG: hypothetical protein ACM3UR_07970 [Bacteroidota bacterium]|jgi:hypothetical protein|nr:hypothetical protein [Ignavibacteria bacterium]MCU7498583.1 hypothetical protein [Ignavibacteria bacterium]MCU7511617.1 hypothetical protein [Ignavibacteria bacterium]MCU7519169.1 hypothetical protein [Ignavibacteria bacterium]MCU7523799.1 hypothetical protein [Ignavibacteria bacterium]